MAHETPNTTGQNGPSDIRPEFIRVFDEERGHGLTPWEIEQIQAMKMRQMREETTETPES